MSWLSHDLKKFERNVGRLIPHTSASERRQAMQAAKEQIDYYQKAKEEMVNTRNENESQKKQERQAINEKEIRSRQRQYRRSGFLETANTGIKETLG